MPDDALDRHDAFLRGWALGFFMGCVAGCCAVGTLWAVS